MGRPNQPQDIFRHINTHDNDPAVCWEWTASLSGRDGRGYFTLDGKKYIAPRFIFNMFNSDNPLKDEEVARHTCDNQLCCNPYHLIRGTHSDNRDDMYSRGRSGTPLHIVTAIRKLANEARRNQLDLPYGAIVRLIKTNYDFDVSISTVGNLLRGKTRKGHGNDE